MFMNDDLERIWNSAFTVHSELLSLRSAIESGQKPRKKKFVRVVRVRADSRYTADWGRPNETGETADTVGQPPNKLQ
jgi:hypothetical protein